MTFNTLFNPITRPFMAWYAQQSNKDQKLLAFLVLFLTLFIIGFSAFTLNQAAQQSAQKLREENSLLTWMAAQYPNLEMSNTANIPLPDLIQSMASNAGLTINSAPQGNTLQISTSHANFAVLGNFLTSLAQQGVSIDNLNIQQQDDGILLLQATASKP